MCTVTRRTQRRWRTIPIMHVDDRRFDGEQSEAARHDTSCQPVQQGLRQGGYLNAMVHTFTAVTVRFCQVSLAAACMLATCRAEPERAGSRSHTCDYGWTRLPLHRLS
jgi:hypothetical protein